MDRFCFWPLISRESFKTWPEGIYQAIDGFGQVVVNILVIDGWPFTANLLASDDHASFIIPFDLERKIRLYTLFVFQ